MDILREARLEPFCIETDATACCNAFLATHGLKNAGAGTTALVNIGHQRSNLAVLNSEGTLLIRDVPWGGVHFTKALGELMSAPVEEAETAKRADWEADASAGKPPARSPHPGSDPLPAPRNSSAACATPSNTG